MTQSAIAQLAEYLSQFGPIQNNLEVSFKKWCPHEVHPKQEEFLHLTQQEAFYGGAAGGGKSDALLMGVCSYLDTPGFSALILRRTYTALRQPDALIPRSHEWWSGKSGAKYDNEQHAWHFPSGAVVKFGYLAGDTDKYQYQSAAFQYIAFDELCQFPQEDYVYLFSRLRRLFNSEVPLKMRSASNPDGPGQAWVSDRFITASLEDLAKYDRAFVPARLADNPSLDQDAYIKSLDYLDPITRAKLLDGDWAVSAGNAFPDFNLSHIIPVQPIPDHWYRFASHDWGFASPGHHLWACAVPADPNSSEIPGPGLIIYRELAFNHLTPQEIAETILHLQAYETIRMTWAGPDIWQEHRSRLSRDQLLTLSQSGQLQLSVADQYNRAGLHMQPTNNARIAGRQTIHQNLRIAPTGFPYLRIMSCCPVLIKTLRNIRVDPNNMEDVETRYTPESSLRDDAYDALRYLLIKYRAPLSDPPVQGGESKASNVSGYKYHDPSGYKDPIADSRYYWSR